MIPIIKSPQYERDLEEMAAHRPGQCGRSRSVVTAIERTIELLSEFPGIGAPCTHLGPGLRRTLWREYLIYYRVREDSVEIARTLHGRRNITSRTFE